MGEEMICDDPKCAANKKRLYTRTKKIKERSRWAEIEGLLLGADVKLIDTMQFPYLIIEGLIPNVHNDDITLHLCKKLGLNQSQLVKQGAKQIYEMDLFQVSRMVEIIILKGIGLNRAEQIIRKLKYEGGFSQ